MAEKITRRDFIKWTGIGAAASVLTGCGPAARYVVRRPYAEMPEYNQTGRSTYYATTCRACAAHCGIIVRTMEGRAIKAEGNPDHPVSKGKICSRGLTLVQGLYNPDRIKKPRRYAARGQAQYEEIEWDQAVSTLQESLQAGGAAFLLGDGVDHLYDFAVDLSKAAGLDDPVRYSVTDLLEGKPALLDAAEQVLGKRAYPYFDLGNASLAFSFGADFLTSWLSPVAYSRAYRMFRQGPEGRRGTLLSFEPNQSVTASNADRWVAIPPGTEGLAARAIGALVAKKKQVDAPAMFADVNLDDAAKRTGLTAAQFEELADLFASASAPLAIPGAVDPAAALELNRLAGNLGKPGGVFLTEAEPELAGENEIRSLIKKMELGEVKTLFVHGVNPLFDLPAGWGFSRGLAKVQRVISFSPFEDETARASDFVFPDSTSLESWGYQKNAAGADRTTWSALQPVVSRLYDTRPPIDAFLAATAGLGAGMTQALPYEDEVEYIQSKLTPLLEGGFYSATDIPSFWAQWLQHGGWWPEQSNLAAPEEMQAQAKAGAEGKMPALAEGQFHLIVFFNHLGDGSGANQPWLQETPDALTTATWGTWVAINPETAKKLGIADDDVVKVESETGSLEAPAYLYPAIRPDCIAIPFGQGHTALGRYAAGRGANPAVLLGGPNAPSALNGQPVKLSRTGTTKRLARLENREGVYGEKPTR